MKKKGYPNIHPIAISEGQDDWFCPLENLDTGHVFSPYTEHRVSWYSILNYFLKISGYQEHLTNLKSLFRASICRHNKFVTGSILMDEVINPLLVAAIKCMCTRCPTPTLPHHRPHRNRIDTSLIACMYTHTYIGGFILLTSIFLIIYKNQTITYLTSSWRTSLKKCEIEAPKT